MIYILTGPIRTGKTTSLLKWAQQREDTTGILCPDDTNGKRYFFQIDTQHRFNLEVSQSTNAETIAVGPFLFLTSAFNEANTYLQGFIKQRKYTYIIIDELGKLELKNKGLHPSACLLIPMYQSSKSQHLILVVRDSLLDAIIEHYQIAQYELITSETISSRLN